MLKPIMLQKIFAFILAVSFFIPAHSRALDFNLTFNPHKLIEDTVFSDTQTFGGPEGIQKFLESKNSVLANTSPDFLIKLKEPNITILKQGLEDPQPSLGRLRTAAELIWDASRHSGINPQVLLVTLQKEQGLITNHHDSSPERLQRALDFAFGFACPDATGCSQNTLFPGFYFQLFGNFDASGNRYLGAAKSLMKSFNTEGGRGPSVAGRVAKVGDTVEITNTTQPYNVPASQLVTLANRATAALYRFTPHVFNGNYNFWKYFNEWFKYPNGTVMRVGSDPATFIIQNGSRLLLPAFVAANRGISLASAITVSPTELESYPAGSVYGPADNTIVQVSGESQKYVFVNNVKHPASDFVIVQRKLNPAAAISISAQESQLFPSGTMLTPSEGTVVRGQQGPEVYLVQGGKLKLFSGFTFAQHKAASRMEIVPDSEIATYPKEGFVPPLDGTLVRTPTDQTVYIMKSGLKQPITATAFKTRGLSFSNLAIISENELGSFALGGFAEPGERTYFNTSPGAQLYIFKEGAKHPISGFVAKQRGITPDYTFPASEAAAWSDGAPIPPRDNTVVKGEGDATVYIVLNGQLRPMTAAAFKNRRLTAAKISVLGQSEVDGYAKGDVLEK